MAIKSTSSKIAFRITSSTLRLLLNLLFYILATMFIFSMSNKAYTFTYQIYGDVSVDEIPGREVLFQIKKGESTIDICKKLEVNRLIKSKEAFFIKAKLTKANILPGTFKLNSSMNYNEIIDTITNYSSAIIREEADE